MGTKYELNLIHFLHRIDHHDSAYIVSYLNVAMVSMGMLRTLFDADVSSERWLMTGTMAVRGRVGTP